MPGRQCGLMRTLFDKFTKSKFGRPTDGPKGENREVFRNPLLSAISQMSKEDQHTIQSLINGMIIKTHGKPSGGQQSGINDIVSGYSTDGLANGR